MPDFEHLEKHRKRSLPGRQAATAKVSGMTPALNTASLVQRAQIDPKNLNSVEVLHLQRSVGNRAVSALLAQQKAQNNTPVSASISATNAAPTIQREDDDLDDQFAGMSQQLKGSEDQLWDTEQGIFMEEAAQARAKKKSEDFDEMELALLELSHKLEQLERWGGAFRPTKNENGPRMRITHHHWQKGKQGGGEQQKMMGATNRGLTGVNKTAPWLHHGYMLDSPATTIESETRSVGDTGMEMAPKLGTQTPFTPPEEAPAKMWGVKGPTDQRNRQLFKMAGAARSPHLMHRLKHGFKSYAEVYAEERAQQPQPSKLEKYSGMAKRFADTNLNPVTMAKRAHQGVNVFHRQAHSLALWGAAIARDDKEAALQYYKRFHKLAYQNASVAKQISLSVAAPVLGTGAVVMFKKFHAMAKKFEAKWPELAREPDEPLTSRAARGEYNYNNHRTRAQTNT